MRRVPNGLRWREGESENEVPRVFLGGRADGKQNNGENIRNEEEEEDEKQGVTTERLRLERESVRTWRSTAWRQIRAPTDKDQTDGCRLVESKGNFAGRRRRCVSYT